MANRGAKKKEAIILAIDIGKNSTQLDINGITNFEKSIQCVSMILKRKILTGSEDHLALILFGSYHTINHLSSQGPCYYNIETVTSLKVATWDLYNRVNSFCTSNVTPSDWINTFDLAADMLKNETKDQFYTGLQIIMFSNLATDISFDNIDVIADSLKMEKIKLTIISKDCEAMLLNPALNAFIKKTEATTVNFDSVLPILSYYKQKEVFTKSWNASLNFGGVFDLNVFGNEKIDVTKSPDYDTQDPTTAMKKHSDENGVKMEVNDNKLPIDDYSGDEIIPIICNTNEGSYIAYTQRCLQVLGFTKTTNMHSSFLMDGGSYIFTPHKKDIIAFNAIFVSMVEREEVMLVRKVDKFFNLLNVGALFPKEEDNEKFFVYVSLPYDDKAYKYKFPQINSIKSHIKEPIVKDAMYENLDRNVFAIPENKYDFGARFLYECIIQQVFAKIIPEQIPCKPPTKSFMKIARLSFESFMETLSNTEKPFEYLSDRAKNAKQYVHGEELDDSKYVISPSNPVDDFYKLLKNGSNPTIVCEKMHHIALFLIKLSSSLEDLLTPISILMTLRGHYINNNDVKSYNNFMYVIKEAFMRHDKVDMWPKFINSERGLITHREIKTSDISQETSEEFMKTTTTELFDFFNSVDENDPAYQFSPLLDYIKYFRDLRNSMAR